MASNFVDTKFVRAQPLFDDIPNLNRHKLLRRRETGCSISSSNYFSNEKFQKEMLSCQMRTNDQQRKQLYFQKDYFAHFGCVNAVEFSSPKEEFLASGGDDRRVLVWKTGELISSVNKPKPVIMKGTHESNIFCLAFTADAQKLLSAGNDQTVIVHHMDTGQSSDVYFLEEAVYTVNTHPDTNQIFLTACEDGTVQLFDQRLPSSEDPLTLASHHAPFHSAAFNPVEPRLIVTANSADGVQLWDVRRPKWCVKRYKFCTSTQCESDKCGGCTGMSYPKGHRRVSSAMCARWDSTGERIFALRRRASPLLYRISSSRPMAIFEDENYHNGCTMKSCTFAGLDDEYVATGSDNFNLYVWKIPNMENFDHRDPKSQTLLVNKCSVELIGHRSIVNQVRYGKTYHVLASSGVEKIVKIWSPWPVDGARLSGSRRSLYSREDYLNMMLESGYSMAASQEEQELRGSTEEDARMMAFFDSLTQRQNDSDSSSDSDDDMTSEMRFVFSTLDDGDEIDLDADSDFDSNDPFRDFAEGVFHRLSQMRQRRLEAGYVGEVESSESSSSSSSSTSIAFTPTPSTSSPDQQSTRSALSQLDRSSPVRASGDSEISSSSQSSSSASAENAERKNRSRSSSSSADLSNDEVRRRVAAAVETPQNVSGVFPRRRDERDRACFQSSTCAPGHIVTFGSTSSSSSECSDNASESGEHLAEMGSRKRKLQDGDTSEGEQTENSGTPKVQFKKKRRITGRPDDASTSSSGARRCYRRKSESSSDSSSSDW